VVPEESTVLVKLPLLLPEPPDVLAVVAVFAGELAAAVLLLPEALLLVLVLPTVAGV
jgi:hypothetical protein